MIRLLICDDEEESVRLLREHAEKYMKSHNIECVITEAYDPSIIMNDEIRYDIAMLDIQMGDVSGTELAAELKKRNSRTVLFFVTNYDEYQDEAMDLHALRFFMKPFDAERLFSGLDKAMEYIGGAYVDIFAVSGSEHRRVPVDDIVYIMNENRKVVIVTDSEKIITKDSIDIWREKLPSHFFFKVHKSFLVNMHYIDRYSNNEIILKDGTNITIAPRRRGEFRKYWFEYIRRL